METTKVNPPGNPSRNPSQSPGGSVGGLAAKVAGAHGVGPSAPAKPIPGKTTPGNKGGRLSAEQEVAKYCAENNLRLVPNETGGNPADIPATPPHLVTPEFIGEITREWLKGFESYRIRSVALKVKTLCGDATLAKEYAESVAAPPGCIDTTSKAMMEIAKKYPAMLQWAPEFAVVGSLAMWMKKDRETMARLDDLEKRLVEQFKAKTPAKPAEVAPTVPSS
jgi:hypothetical protein